MRRGISLLEVLVAIFITAVGLLAVAALIPVGTFYVGEANKNVRGWDMAQVAYRAITVHDMLDRNRWVDGGGFPAQQPGEVFVIDPIYFARNGGIWQTPITSQPQCWFPYAAADSVEQGLPRPYQVARLSINAWSNGKAVLLTTDTPPRRLPIPMTSAAPAMFAEPFDDQNGNGVRDGGEPFRDLPTAAARLNVPLGNGRWDDRSHFAEKVFSGRDDLVFTAPADRQQRPFPVNMVEPYTDANSDGAWQPGEPFTDLNGNGQWDNQSVVDPSAGDYSWMITGEFGQLNERSCSISVVVFYMRQVSFAPLAAIPGERTVFADLQDGTAEGGRYALLHYTASSPGATDYLNIKAGEWIALHGVLNSTPPRKTLRWHRIVSVGDIEDDLPVAGQPQVKRRRVVLAGPDIDARLAGNLYIDQHSGAIDPQYPGVDSPTIHATLVPGVVNVFSRTVQTGR